MWKQSLMKMNHRKSGLEKWKIPPKWLLKILLFSQRCHQNGHRITYCRQDESTEDHYSQGFLNSSLFDYLASDYLTIWLFGDRMEGVTELCKARRRSREGKSDYPGDWLTSSSGSGSLSNICEHLHIRVKYLAHLYAFVHIHLRSLFIVQSDPCLLCSAHLWLR